ncbi:MAG: tRNA uridine-5-carboxymethylaminomethyl(34) synthesis enzyme MnmG [Pyrinomonadaceae bacterium]|nr:tRNA uridine-5-carboxymethylaminomethyl(34) synthesis enzyme MnmG [Pyrinomonadaceae bacterium]
MSFDESFDVIVIGAGHAGCEAASAAARMGAETAIITLNLDLIGQMSCNPAVGGVAKGHLVREIDALGGIIGRVTDRTGIQFRLLNRSRGPAVQAPRAQADRALYRTEMRHTLEATPNLHLRQGLVIELIVEDGLILGVELQDTRRLRAKAVVLATGTFLNGLVHTGRRTYTAGRAGEPAAIDLAEGLKQLGFPVGRLKTGTPPRLDGRTIDWNAFEPQPADERPVPFSFSTESIEQPQIMCYVGHTTEVVHQTIRNNIHESPLYSGQISSIGPRYCPSIEDKVIKFPDKPRHQLFLEPEGHDTHEVYLNGFSTSMPAELQQELVRQIPGLDEARVIRPGYAIEYDFVDPRELSPQLETTRIKGLFLAGQINGTTGYEEAACQGLIAGINSALYVQKREPFSLLRQDSYIGVLIDDLITHGVDEPYRMFTSRSEHRLSLRYDTADSRLSPLGHTLGLLGDTAWERFNQRRQRLALLRATMDAMRVKRGDNLHTHLYQTLGCDLDNSPSLSNLVQRHDVPLSTIHHGLPPTLRTAVSLADVESVAADIIYSGYIDTQQSANERLYKHDGLLIPTNFNFTSLSSLSHEMIHRLERAHPQTFGQARRTPGMTPAALATLLVRLKSPQAA